MQIVHVLQAFHALLITLLHRQGSLNQPGYHHHEQGTLRHALMELRAQRICERETKQCISRYERYLPLLVLLN
jgi:hypothetical protein